MSRSLYFIFLFPFLSACPFAQTISSEMDVYVVPPLKDKQPAHMRYYYDLLALCLEKTRKEFGDYEIRESANGQDRGATSRTLRTLMTGESINVVWTMRNQEYMEQLAAIEVPILKNTNGFRLFLIRKDDQESFDAVQAAQDLRKLRAGLPKSWPDTEIMLKNGLNVVSAGASYENVINMLKRNRVDYFPRGAYEILEESKQFPDLVIEQSLALRYEAPIYFFLKDRGRLFQRLKAGLEASMADGSFDTLFQSIPAFRYAENEMANSKRLVFDLNLGQ